MRIASSRMFSLVSAGIVAAGLAAGSALAQQPQHQPKDTTRTRTYGGATDTASVPRNAHFRCSDGTYSTARRARGACTRHGGIADTLGTWSGNRANRARAKTGNPSSTDTMDMSRPRTDTMDMDRGRARKDTMDMDRSRSRTDTLNMNRSRAGRTDSLDVRGGSQSNTMDRDDDDAMPSDTGSARGAERQRMERDSTNATAKCKDGTWSHSHRKSGTCASHGGVDRWTGADSTRNQRQPQQ